MVEEYEAAKAARDPRVTEYRHTGFGFAGDAGHDVLIVQKLEERLKKAILGQMRASNHLRVHGHGS